MTNDQRMTNSQSPMRVCCPAFRLSGHSWAGGQAIRQLPEQGAIRNHYRTLPLNSAQTLAETNFLMIVVDLEKQRNATQTSDLLVEFHKTNIQICSLFGCVVFDYPDGWNFEFN